MNICQLLKCLILEINNYHHHLESVRGDKTVTLMFNIEKNTMKEVSDNDKMRFDWNDIDADVTNLSRNKIGPNMYNGYYYMKIDRQVPADDMKNMDLV